MLFSEPSAPCNSLDPLLAPEGSPDLAHAPTPEMEGSLIPFPDRGLRSCLSLSIRRFSSLCRADSPDVPMGSDSSSSADKSSKLPPAFTFISTPLSLLFALPKGDRSLLQDDWPPGLGCGFWVTMEAKPHSVIKAINIALLGCFPFNWQLQSVGQSAKV